MQDGHLNRARASIRGAIAHYSKQLRGKGRSPKDAERQMVLKQDIDRLTVALDKITGQTLKIAVFGMVSRGKSAVINALLGQKFLQTGPLHGVTRWPRSVYWTPLADLPAASMITDGQHAAATPIATASSNGAASQLRALSVELIDTPGLEEVGGDERADVAADVAQQADLILFVISGDITRTEYQAIAQLRAAYKPLLVVFNKIDLYPDYDRRTIAQKLNALLEETGGHRSNLTLDDIVCVAAEPSPVQVKTEWPGGEVTYEWESPSPQIDHLRDRLLTLLAQEGNLLLALNALRETQSIEQHISQTALVFYDDDAEELIWKFASWKAIAIAANPIAVLDLMGGAVADLVLIRSLARLYGLPMTGYEAGKLWNAIVWSSGSLLVGELGSGLLLGVGKSAAAFASVFESATGLAAYSTAAIAQATLAGYGTYRVGKAAQVYLEQGCSWGPRGSSRAIQDIVSHLDRETLLTRLQRDIEESQHPSSA